MLSFIYSLEIINVVVREAESEGHEAKSEGRSPDPKIFLWITASAAAAAVNPNGNKTLFVNDWSTFFITSEPVFSNGPKSLSRNPPNCPILCNWFLDNFILAEELFAKALWNFETCVLVNNNLCGKLFSSLESPATFDESFKVTSVLLFYSRF